MVPLLVAMAPMALAQTTYTMPGSDFWAHQWGDSSTGSNKWVLDILIVPPEHGQIFNLDNGLFQNGDVLGETSICNNSYVAAIEDSIEDWRVGIAQFGESPMNTSLVLDDDVLYCESTETLTTYEIVITTSETGGPVLGFGGGGVTAFGQTPPCHVNNFRFFAGSFSYEDMFNVNLQEVGHCFGLGHVGGDQPAHDPMDGSYDHLVGLHGGAHLHCVSNLDVKGLDRIFNDDHYHGAAASVLEDDYEQIDCNPAPQD